jgi:hypothetical protein
MEMLYKLSADTLAYKYAIGGYLFIGTRPEDRTCRSGCLWVARICECRILCDQRLEWYRYKTSWSTSSGGALVGTRGALLALILCSPQKALADCARYSPLNGEAVHRIRFHFDSQLSSEQIHAIRREIIILYEYSVSTVSKTRAGKIMP